QDYVRCSFRRGPANGRKTVDDGRLDPDQALALRVQLGLVADAAERERGGYRLEGGGSRSAPFCGLRKNPRPAPCASPCRRDRACRVFPRIALTSECSQVRIM